MFLQITQIPTQSFADKQCPLARSESFRFIEEALNSAESVRRHLSWDVFARTLTGRDVFLGVRY